MVRRVLVPTRSSSPITLPKNIASQVTALRKKIHQAEDPETLVKVCIAIDNLEDLIRRAGYQESTEAVRPANETRFEARWRLGQMLAKIEKQRGGRGQNSSQAGKSFFGNWLKDVGLDKNRASEAQRIGAIPTLEILRDKPFKEAAEQHILNTTQSLIDFAQPWWRLEARAQRHRTIAAAAEPVTETDIGTFPLIYADPPWRFETYSAAGGGRSPDQKYPTLSDEEIIDFKINGRPMREIAHRDAVLFLWCTPFNEPLAQRVMERWGFAYKSSAAWVKEDGGRLQIGMGQIFRNAHEVLLYGSRGDVTGPVEIPLSVFKYPRGQHSAKPPEIRATIERMYPAFSDCRLEVFARGFVQGWTTYGFEANRAAA
jgi:N6-adenosine-specific RNA methylase IME4